MALLASTSGAAEAATYNIYLNNTEQGPNSQASPSVSISQNPASAPAVAPQSSSKPVVSEEERKMWTLAALYRLESGVPYRSYSQPNGFFDQNSPRTYAFALGFRPRQDLHGFVEMNLKAIRAAGWGYDSTSTAVGLGMGLDWLPLSTRVFEFGPTARLGVNMHNSPEPTIGLTSMTYFARQLALATSYRIGESTNTLELGLRIVL